MGLGTAVTNLGVLGGEENTTKYLIMVEVADRQPALSQKEIAKSIGITTQAVSEHLKQLSQEGYIKKEGRGRYRATKKGIDWLISRTNDLEEITRYVKEEVIGGMDIEPAIATENIEKGSRIALEMKNGYIHVSNKNESSSATGTAINDAEKGEQVGITDIEGVLDLETGKVTILSIPTIRNKDTTEINQEEITRKTQTADLIAVSGVEAYLLLKELGVEPDIEHGTQEAVKQAATRGLDVTLVLTKQQLSSHTEKLHSDGINHNVIDYT